MDEHPCKPPVHSVPVRPIPHHDGAPALLLAGLAALALGLAPACGARSDLPGSPPAAGEGGGTSTGHTTSTSAGGGSPLCPVTSFEGDRTGGVRLVMDDAEAYWTTTANRIERGDISTGEVVTLLEAGENSIGAIGLDGSHVYGADDTRIFRIPRTGGALESVADASIRPVALVVETDRIFVLHHGGGFLDGAVYQWSASDGLELLFEGLDFPVDMAADDTGVYVACQGAVIDGDFVDKGAILRVDRETGAAAVAVGGLEDPFAVDLHGGSIILGEWLSPELEIDARLLAAPAPGGAATPIGPISTDSLPVAMALDDAFAYVTLPHFAPGGGASSELLRIALAGGLPEVIAGLSPGFFTEPRATAARVAFTVQPTATGEMVDANVRSLCK